MIQLRRVSSVRYLVFSFLRCTRGSKLRSGGVLRVIMVKVNMGTQSRGSGIPFQASLPNSFGSSGNWICCPFLPILVFWLVFISVDSGSLLPSDSITTFLKNSASHFLSCALLRRAAACCIFCGHKPLDDFPLPPKCRSPVPKQIGLYTHSGRSKHGLDEAKGFHYRPRPVGLSCQMG